MATLEAIPGYAAAVEQEQLVRDAAFFPVTESVGGFECRPMTLRDFLVLRVARNPLLFRQIPTPEQLTAFLWLLCPAYRQGGKGKRRFLRHARDSFASPPYRALFNTKRARAAHRRKCMAKTLALARTIEAALAYVAETFQDRPPASATLGFEASYFSDAAEMCALFARQYGWQEEHVLTMPLKRLFQYLNEIKREAGAKTPLCNPSDKVRADWLAAMNRRN